MLHCVYLAFDGGAPLCVTLIPCFCASALEAPANPNCELMDRRRPLSKIRMTLFDLAARESVDGAGCGGQGDIANRPQRFFHCTIGVETVVQ